MRSFFENLSQSYTWYLLVINNVGIVLNNIDMHCDQNKKAILIKLQKKPRQFPLNRSKSQKNHEFYFWTVITNLKEERLPWGRGMGETERLLYFRVVVVFHNLEHKN